MILPYRALRFARTALVLFACLFLVLEAYYQIVYRWAALLPPFIRLYDQRYLDENGTPRLPAGTEGWHRSYGGRPDVLIRINSHGFRGKEPSSNKPRVVLLGDSVVFNGAVELHETFPVLLESMHRNLELLNLGVGDTNMRQHYLKLIHQALDLKPDLTIVFVYLNDAIESHLSTHRSNRLSSSWVESLAYIHIQKFFRDLRVIYQAHSSDRWNWIGAYQKGDYLRNEDEWQRLVKESRYDWGSGWEEKSWEIIGSWGVKMQEVARQHGIPLWFVVMPAVPQVVMPKEVGGLLLPQELARAHLKGSFLIDPLPIFRAREDREELFYDHCHLTPKGNYVMAELLSPALREWISSLP